MESKSTSESGVWLMITEEFPKDPPQEEPSVNQKKEGLAEFFDSYGFYPDSTI